VVNTLSGHEQKASAGLKARVSSLSLEGRIHEVLLPTQQVTVFTRGRKETTERKLYPGYLLVRCDLDDEVWFAIRHTPGVSGFAGQNQRSQRPTPLSAKEAAAVVGKVVEKPASSKQTMGYPVGSVVKVVAGPFAEFVGTVTTPLSQNRLRLVLNVFGRETPIELDADQVRRP